MKIFLNKIQVVFMFFCIFQLQGQTFDFETNKGGWDSGHQISSADLDVSTGRNTLKCVRENNNATLVLNAATATIDPTTKNFLKLVVKNESNATQFRIKAETTNSSDKTINFTTTANDTEFKTYVFDLNTHATWNNATTTTEEINLLFRSGYDVAEGSIFIDEITFYNSSAPINRELPADVHFYNPTINTGNTAIFPAGDSSTSALQTMIDNLSSSGGGVLTISAGTYTLGQVHMKTGVHIRVHPDVIFKSAPQNSLFRAGYDNNFTNVSNWSFTSTNGERFTFDFSDMNPHIDGIRAFQLGNTTNFKISDFVVLDNFTKFNAISSGAVGDPDISGDYTQGSAKFASFGIIENLDTKKAHYGYGLIQCQVGQDILFRDLSGEGGVTLRFESGFEGLANRYLQDNTPTIQRVYGRNISCKNGAHALMISPHTITQGVVDVRDISSISCEATVSAMFGFLSENKGQEDSSGNPLNGHTLGTFSEESVVTNVSATFGTKAQVRAARLKFVPCTLKSYISVDKNLDDESYEAPSLSAGLILALEDYTSFNAPAGRYQIVLENVSHTGFSSEVRADGLITDNNDDDFNGCATYAKNLTVADGNWDNVSSWESSALPSQGELKTIAHNIIINSDVVSDATIAINDSKTLTITSGNSLTLNSDIVTNNGLILEHGVQLKITGKSTGNAKYKRTLTAIDNGATANKEGWFSVSPPVSGEALNTAWADANILATGTGGNRGLATYIESNNTWSYFNGTATTFIAGKGYIVKRTTDGTVTFEGTLNTEDTGVNVAVTNEGTGFNLLGNPYTSKISSATFITNNTNDLALEEIYIWNDDGNKYETYNKSGDFKVAPGQAFFVKVNKETTLNFAETNQEIGADTFQKSSRSKIKLTVENGNTNRYAEVYYIENATKGYDRGYDGEVFGGIPDDFSLYTHLLENNQGENYQIQALPNSDLETMVVPVGLKLVEDAEITFKLEANNIPDGLNVFLEDRQENTFTQLDVLNAEYKVSVSKESNEIGRFYLHTTSKSTLKIDATLDLSKVAIYIINSSTLKIIGLQQEKVNLKLFTILGKQIMNSSFLINGTKNIDLPKTTKGVYLVQLETEMGLLNKKIFIK